MTPRPPFLTFCAICGIIVGFLGVVCQPITTFGQIVQGNLMEMPDVPLIGLTGGTYEMHPVAVAVMIVSRILTFFYCLLLIASSIGCFSLKPWARKGMVLYAILSILNNIVFLIAQAIAQMPMMTAIMQGQMGGESGEAFMQAGALIGVLCMLPFYVAFPLFILIAMNTRRIRESFELGYDPHSYAAQQQQGYGYYPQQQYDPRQGYGEQYGGYGGDPYEGYPPQQGGQYPYGQQPQQQAPSQWPEEQQPSGGYYQEHPPEHYGPEEEEDRDGDQDRPR